MTIKASFIIQSYVSYVHDHDYLSLTLRVFSTFLNAQVMQSLVVIIIFIQPLIEFYLLHQFKFSFVTKMSMIIVVYEVL